MNRTVSVSLASLAVLTGFAGSTFAQVTNINSVRIQLRRFNDYPGSTLVVTNNFPSLVSFNESAFGAGGFANQHVARFSSDSGATNRAFLNSEAFDISVNVNLSVGSATPAIKEAGFRMDTFIGGEGFFIVKSNGEVAAFGGPLPFHTFGGSAYTPGTTVNLRMRYAPGAIASMEYFYNGVSSGLKFFGNTENGVINGSDLGTYVQNAPNDNFSGDFSNAAFTNYVIAVPEPGTMIALAAGAALFIRRRRKA